MKEKITKKSTVPNLSKQQNKSMARGGLELTNLGLGVERLTVWANCTANIIAL